MSHLSAVPTVDRYRGSEEAQAAARHVLRVNAETALRLLGIENPDTVGALGFMPDGIWVHLREPAPTVGGVVVRREYDHDARTISIEYLPYADDQEDE